MSLAFLFSTGAALGLGSSPSPRLRSRRLAMSTRKNRSWNLVFLASTSAVNVSSSATNDTNPKPLSFLFSSLTTTACFTGQNWEKYSCKSSEVASNGISRTKRVLRSRPSSLFVDDSAMAEVSMRLGEASLGYGARCPRATIRDELGHITRILVFWSKFSVDFIISYQK